VGEGLSGPPDNFDHVLCFPFSIDLSRTHTILVLRAKIVDTMKSHGKDGGGGGGDVEHRMARVVQLVAGVSGPRNLIDPRPIPRQWMR